MEQVFKDYPISRALISVSDKSGLGELVSVLKKAEVEIIGSGGTARAIRELGYEVTPVEQVSGNPEAFNGRVKTLSFNIAGALLFNRSNEDDCARAGELGISPIDLVVCNLYPFANKAKSDLSLDELLEQIDIGGPTMIRAAAKNYYSIATLVNPRQYGEFIENFASNNGTTKLSYRKKLALAAFECSAGYEMDILARFVKEQREAIGDMSLESEGGVKSLRYGENPHQRGRFIEGDIKWEVLQGKELSYNNYLDVDAAVLTCGELQTQRKDANAVVVVKHTNPCGAALADDQLDALQAAWSGDPISAFGGILAFNRRVTKESAEFLTSKFVEVIAAPGFSPEAVEIFSDRKNLRLIKCPIVREEKLQLRSLGSSGGFLIQEADNKSEIEEFKWVTDEQVSDLRLSLVRFGVGVCSHLKSNAVAVVGQSAGVHLLLGAGMGNPNRIVSAEQAVAKALERDDKQLSKLMSEALLVSDAFLPFSDVVEVAAEAGIKTIVQPGGSRNDGDIIDACNKMGIAMAFTGIRHFRH